MIKVKCITLNRAEGLVEDCNKPVTVKSFDEAQDILFQWGNTAPKNGGYDKVDFAVVWEDGEDYKGRYDMIYGGCEHGGTGLALHIHDYLIFLAGMRKPEHISEENYQHCIARHVKDNPNHIQEIKDFLEKYQILNA